MQRNGRAKSESAQSGRWIFKSDPHEITIAKSGLYAVANRLYITDWYNTPNSVLPYFTSRDFGQSTANVECELRGKGISWGTGMLGVDQPVEFVIGEALIEQLPIFIDCETSVITGPICTGFDPNSGSNIGAQLLSHVSPDGKDVGINHNRNCITRVCTGDQILLAIRKCLEENYMLSMTSTFVRKARRLISPIRKSSETAL
jgi:hypothetical protein